MFRQAYKACPSKMKILKPMQVPVMSLFQSDLFEVKSKALHDRNDIFSGL